MGLRAFACRMFGVFGTFGTFEGWQTAGLNANKKLYCRKLLRWPWWAFVPLPAACLEGLEGLERLKAGKRQA